MRLLQYLLIISFLLLATESPLFGDDKSASKLLIVTEDVYPLNYLDKETGEIKGFAVEYLKDILKKAKLEHTLEMLPWARAYKIAQNKSNVLIFGLARTAERENNFIWLTDFITLDFYLYGLRSRTDEITKKDENYLDSPIGVIRYDFNHTEMLSAGYKKLLPAEHQKHLSLLLLKERADFIVAGGNTWRFFDEDEELDGKLLYRAKALPFLNVPIYYAFSKGTDPKIISTMKSAVKELKNDPDYVQPSELAAKVINP